MARTYLNIEKLKNFKKGDIIILSYYVYYKDATLGRISFKRSTMCEYLGLCQSHKWSSENYIEVNRGKNAPTQFYLDDIRDIEKVAQEDYIIWKIKYA